MIFWEANNHGTKNICVVVNVRITDPKTHEDKVEMLDDVYYRFNDINDADLQTILESFDIKIEKKLYKIGDIKQIKRDIICHRST